LTTEVNGEEPTHRSIGEVLSSLQEDFPDVTISKIRFLEGQGLIAPERTPSGYRKFLPNDISRLRWILRCQRDQFLPLRVIKAKLESDPDINFDAELPELPDRPDPSQPELFDEPGADPPATEAATADTPAPATPAPPASVGVAARPGTASPGRAGVRTRGPSSRRDPGAWLAALQEAPGTTRGDAPPEIRVPEPAVPPPTERLLDGSRYTVEELAIAAGVSEESVEELVRYGLIASHSVGGVATFDGHAVSVARSARYFIGIGIGPRHLRMYKLAADREAGFYEQLILPLLRQRNPRARQDAVDRLSELIERGEHLRLALITQALRDHLGS